MRQISAATVAVLVTLVTTGASAPVASAVSLPAATCDGEPATIVGTPGQEHLYGTSGPDVIVSNGAAHVDAGAGEDLVCLTGGDTTVQLDSPDENSSDDAWAEDRVIGTGGDDVVQSGSYDDFTELRYDTENTDEIVLGPGDSTLVMVGAPVGVVRGGAGRDRLVLQGSGDTGDDTLTIDLAGGEIGFTGHAPAALASFESFHLDRSDYAELVFRGTAASESVYTHQTSGELSGPGPSRLDVDLGDGDDILSIGDRPLSGTLSGGAGSDELRQVAYNRDAVVSLDRGRVRTRNLEGEGVSFERLLASAGSVRATGDARANRITVRACTATVDGRAGDDVLDVDALRFCDQPRHRVSGGLGDDRLLAARGRDTLLGGPGRDVARGGAGVDVCSGETVRSCERRP